MKIVYIAGPYTPINPLINEYCARDLFINVARGAAAWCAENGIGFFCPHLNSAHFEVVVPNVPYEFWMELDLRILSHCDGLLLLPDWHLSKGAKRERDFALANDIPIFQVLADREELLEWAKKE